jgi:hypothetical protein
MVELNDKQKLALYKKSQSSGYSTGVLEEVYRRGYSLWDESFTGNPEQFGFDRVNSFIAGGFAAELDEDLLEGKVKAPTGDLKKACWKGYTAVGMKMKNGRKVPNCVPEEYTGAEKVSHNKNKPSSRFEGTSQATAVFASDTPGESKLATIKKVVSEATYQGKNVPLNKPMKGDVKKSKVFVDPDGDGNAQKVNFGDKNMTIKKHIKGNKDSYCARSEPLGNDPKKANYWSRKAWDC